MTQDKEITIIVNASPKSVKKGKLSYEEIVELAFPGHPADPNVEYIVTYAKGPDDKKEGDLTPGDSINVKDGMVFNVRTTNKS